MSHLVTTVLQTETEARLKYLQKILGGSIPEGTKLNLGCGRIKFPESEGWVNVDKNRSLDPNSVRDLDTAKWLFRENKYTFCVASHLVEHIVDLPFFMQQLYSCMVPDGLVYFVAPYAWSNKAIEDPTHVRFINENSFSYFDRSTDPSNNGYNWFSVDFDMKWCVLIPEDEFINRPSEELNELKNYRLNVIKEIQFLLQVKKPLRTKEPGKCRVCGCTDNDCRQCVEAQGEPCYWVEEDLCSRCAREVKS